MCLCHWLANSSVFFLSVASPPTEFDGSSSSPAVRWSSQREAQMGEVETVTLDTTVVFFQTDWRLHFVHLKWNICNTPRKSKCCKNDLETSFKKFCLYCIAKSKLARHNFSNYISQMCDLFAIMTISKYYSLKIWISLWIFRTVSINHNLLKGQKTNLKMNYFTGKRAEKIIIYSWEMTMNPNSRVNNCGAIQTYLELQAKTFTNDKLQLASKRKRLS